MRCSNLQPGLPLQFSPLLIFFFLVLFLLFELLRLFSSSFSFFFFFVFFFFLFVLRPRLPASYKPQWKKRISVSVREIRGAECGHLRGRGGLTRRDPEDDSRPASRMPVSGVQSRESGPRGRPSELLQDARQPGARITMRSFAFLVSSSCWWV